MDATMLMLVWIAVGWSVIPFLLKYGLRYMRPCTVLLFYCAGIMLVATIVGLLYRAEVARDLRAARLGAIALVFLAACIGVFATYNFLSSLAQKKHSTLVVILVTYCLPAVLAGFIAYLLYNERITPVGYVSALAVFVSMYVFAMHGTASKPTTIKT